MFIIGKENRPNTAACAVILHMAVLALWMVGWLIKSTTFILSLEGNKGLSANQTKFTKNY